MLSLKSNYLSNIKDLSYGNNCIDVLVTNNSGSLIDKIPQCTVMNIFC